MSVVGAGSKRVLAIVQSLGGTRYVTAHGAAGYLDHEEFERAGVLVEYADYSKTYYGLKLIIRLRPTFPSWM